MAAKGIVVKFDSQRGFGFIRLSGAAGDVFVHITDVAGRTTLVRGQRVTCDVVETPKGLAARNVQPGPIESSPFSIFLVVATLLTGAVALVLRFQLSVPWVPGIFLGINGASFLLYGYDKLIAGGQSLRVPEALLHLLAAMGGTPAAFLAQVVFRHKTRKESFQCSFWVIAFFQALLVGGWIWCSVSQPPWIPKSLRFLFPH
jgi:uncharacterized membrane protein YsdA (DUF1294 family)/cold shock CspA family protein